MRNKPTTTKTTTFNLFILILTTLFCLHHCELQQVVSLFRHGARWHLHDYAGANETLSQWGELTSVGMRQHENLGKILSKEYIHKLKFLNEVFNKSEVELYTTRVNRTIQSGISQLYGMYPAGNGNNMPYVKRNLHLPPFSNHTDLEEQNFALPEGHTIVPFKFDQQILMDNCPNFNKLLENNIKLHDSEIKEMNLTYYPFMKKAADIFNISQPMDLQIASNLFDSLNVNKYANMPIDSRFTEEDFDNLKHLLNWYNGLKFSGQISKMINTGKFIKIIKEFDARIKNIDNYPLKWTFLSAHDTDVVPALVDLNISSYECIEELYRKGKTEALNCQTDVGFASSLIFELHLGEGEGLKSGSASNFNPNPNLNPNHNKINYYVMIRSQGKYMNLCEKKEIKCNYEEFKQRLSKYILTNLNELCGIKEEYLHQKEKQKHQKVVQL